MEYLAVQSCCCVTMVRYFVVRAWNIVRSCRGYFVRDGGIFGCVTMVLYDSGILYNHVAGISCAIVEYLIA